MSVQKQNNWLSGQGERCNVTVTILSDISVKVEDLWGPWSDWSPCPALCGQASVQIRSRNCQSPLLPCVGPKVEGKACSGHECQKTGKLVVVYVMFFFSLLGYQWLFIYTDSLWMATVCWRSSGMHSVLTIWKRFTPTMREKIIICINFITKWTLNLCDQCVRKVAGVTLIFFVKCVVML